MEGEKKEDELSIDFSGIWNKITKILKTEKKTKETANTETHESKDGPKEKPSQEPAKESFEKKDTNELISVDTKKLAKWAPLLLVFIPIILAISIRSIPKDIPLAEQWSKDVINNNLKNTIRQQVNAQYPNLPDAKKNELVETEAKKFIESNQAQLDEQIKAQAGYFKERFKTPDGETYLSDIDTWLWFRHYQNIIDHGYPGEKLVDGKSYDTLKEAPWGGFEAGNFHTWWTAYAYKFLSIFFDIGQMTFFFFVSTIIASLSVIPAFFITKRIAGNIAGFISAILIAIHPAYLTRTVGGVADTDPYPVFFALMVTWVFIEMFYATSFKKRATLAIIAGLVAGIFRFAWPGWWYIFDFLLASFFGSIIIEYAYSLYQKKPASELINKYKEPLKIVGIFVAASAIFVTLFGDLNGFLQAFTGPFRIIFTFKAAAKATLFPNVYTTVAELNPASFREVVTQIGGMLMLSIAFAGCILSVFKKDKDGKRDIKLATLLIIWFFGTLFASTRGVRFIMLMVPAFCIAFGVGVGLISQFLAKLLEKSMNVPGKLTKVVIIGIFCLLLITPYNTAKYQAEHSVTMMNDGWWDSLKKIEADSTENAIITSWWDFGHWFKAIAHRKVTFDGGTQNRPQAHWVGKILIDEDIEQSIGILRMLNCGGQKALDEILRKNGGNSLQAVDTLYSIFKEDVNGAREKLKAAGIEDTETILGLTHCQPPDSYLITSEDMVGKSGVWGHFGSWDFRRAKIWMELRKLPAIEGVSEIEKLGYTKEESTRLYNEANNLKDEGAANTWIANWHSYVNNKPSPCQVQGEVVFCQNGALINTTSMQAVMGINNQALLANSVVHVSGKEVVETKPNTTQALAGVSVILIPKGNSYQAMLAAPEQAYSLFTRLFYLEGHGTKHFEKLSDVMTVTGWRVIVWKIDWTGSQNLIPFYQEPVNETIVIEDNESNNSVKITTETELETNQSEENLTNELTDAKSVNESEA